MIAHEIIIRVVEDPDNIGLEIFTPSTLSMLEVVGAFETAKKQYIESKHNTGPTIFQTPQDTLGHEGSDRWTGGDRKDEL